MKKTDERTKTGRFCINTAAILAILGIFFPRRLFRSKPRDVWHILRISNFSKCFENFTDATFRNMYSNFECRCKSDAFIAIRSIVEPGIKWQWNFTYIRGIFLGIYVHTGIFLTFRGVLMVKISGCLVQLGENFGILRTF